MSSSLFACKDGNTKECISKKQFKCDGIKNCPNGDDEDGCPKLTPTTTTTITKTTTSTPSPTPAPRGLNGWVIALIVLLSLTVVISGAILAIKFIKRRQFNEYRSFD